MKPLIDYKEMLMDKWERENAILAAYKNQHEIAWKLKNKDTLQNKLGDQPLE